jgi:hypothetical protein
MSPDNFNATYRKVGQTSCYMVFGLGICYALVTTIGLLSLKSSHDAIGDPYFTIMEILSILIALLMTISIAAVYCYASPVDKLFSLVSLVLISITTGITSIVHFLILSISHSTEAGQLKNYSFIFSFKWPSIVYALDILAWDLFFGLSMLFAVPVFRKVRLGKILKILLIISGMLSLIGLIGVPLQNIQVRNIGIIGYAVVAPFAFLLIGKNFERSNQVLD